MFDIANPALWLIGIIVLMALVLLVRSYFSAEARDRRRRDRSHGRVISRRHAPSVRLAANLEKPGKERK